MIGCDIIDLDEVDIESSGDGCYRNSETLFGILAELRQAGKFCDAALKVRNQVYPIHRNILSACSPFFKSLFTNQAFSTNKKEVVIPDLPPEAARMLIDFAYTGTAKMTPVNVELLLPLADQYHVTGLLKLCCEYLHSNLTLENCIGILLFAQFHSCKGLEKAALRYVLRNFYHVYTQSNEFLQLPLDMMCRLLRSDQLNVSCEEYVFDSICRWIDYDVIARKCHMCRLLSTVRLGLLPSTVFWSKVKTHRLVKDNADCLPLIQETEAFLTELDRSAEPDFDMSLPFARPRVPHDILFVIGGWSGGRPIKMVETYDTRADRWVVCSSEDSSPRAYHGGVAIGCLIYIIGGFDATDCFNSCRVFDTRTKLWSEVAPMNYKRSYVSTALLDGHIYAMGGFEGPPRIPNGALMPLRHKSAERFSPKANQWTLISSMIERRSDANATTHQGQIYICGGFNGSECLRSAEAYNPVCDQWTLLPSMSTRRSGVGVIAYNNAIFAVGGFDGMSRMNTAEAYVPGDMDWTPVPSMYNARSNFAVEVIDDMLFAIGGFNGETTIYNVECYDSQANEWYNATDMNLYKSALSACVVRDLSDVRDYVYKQTKQSDKQVEATAMMEPNAAKPTSGSTNIISSGTTSTSTMTSTTTSTSTTLVSSSSASNLAATTTATIITRTSLSSSAAAATTTTTTATASTNTDPSLLEAMLADSRRNEYDYDTNTSSNADHIRIAATMSNNNSRLDSDDSNTNRAREVGIGIDSDDSSAASIESDHEASRVSIKDRRRGRYQDEEPPVEVSTSGFTIDGEYQVTSSADTQVSSIDATWEDDESTSSFSLSESTDEAT